MPEQSEDAAEPRSIVISLRLGLELAQEFRTEAARRGLRLNVLFARMWEAFKASEHAPSR